MPPTVPHARRPAFAITLKLVAVWLGRVPSGSRGQPPRPCCLNRQPSAPPHRQRPVRARRPYLSSSLIVTFWCSPPLSSAMPPAARASSPSPAPPQLAVGLHLVCAPLSAASADPRLGCSLGLCPYRSSLACQPPPALCSPVPAPTHGSSPWLFAAAP